MQNFVASGYDTMSNEFTGHILICTILIILGRIFGAYIISNNLRYNIFID